MKKLIVFTLFFAACSVDGDGLSYEDTATDTASSTDTQVLPNRGPAPSTVVDTATNTTVITQSATNTVSNTVTQSNTASNTKTETITQSNTNTATQSNTASNTTTQSNTASNTTTQSNTASNTVTQSGTDTTIQTSTQTNVPTGTVTSTSTAVYTVTVVSTNSHTSTVTETSVTVSRDTIDMCSPSLPYSNIGAGGVTFADFPGKSFVSVDHSNGLCNDVLPPLIGTFTCTEYVKTMPSKASRLCDPAAVAKKCGYCKVFCGRC